MELLKFVFLTKYYQYDEIKVDKLLGGGGGLVRKAEGQ